MKRGLAITLIAFSLIFVLALSFVSAGWFSDFVDGLQGRVTGMTTVGQCTGTATAVCGGLNEIACTSATECEPVVYFEGGVRVVDCLRLPCSTWDDNEQVCGNAATGVLGCSWDAGAITFTATPDRGPAPLPVEFNADAGFESYSWDFGDDKGLETGCEGNVTTDCRGLGESGCFTTTACESFYSQAGKFEDCDILECDTWSDLSNKSVCTSIPGCGWVEGKEASHTYDSASAQPYTVTLTAADSQGNTLTASKQITVSGAGGEEGCTGYPSSLDCYDYEEERDDCEDGCKSNAPFFCGSGPGFDCLDDDQDYVTAHECKKIKDCEEATTYEDCDPLRTGCIWQGESEEGAECTVADDSDSNTDSPYYVKGELKGIEDSCDGDVLTEWSCQDGEIVSETKTCSFGCLEGACILPTGVSSPSCESVGGGPRISPKTRLEDGTYCDPLTLKYSPQKDIGYSCIEDYQCESNSCLEGECYAVRTELQRQAGILTRILCIVANIGDYIRGDAESYCGCLTDRGVDAVAADPDRCEGVFGAGTTCSEDDTGGGDDAFTSGTCTDDTENSPYTDSCDALGVVLTEWYCLNNNCVSKLIDCEDEHDYDCTGGACG